MRFVKKVCSLLLAAVFVLALTCGQALASDVVKSIMPLERNGYKLHVASYSLNDSKAKEPILLVHGLTYSSHEFDVNYKDYSLARFLAKKGFEVWTFDVTGYGSSQPVEDGFMPDSNYAADDIAAVVKAVLAKHNLKNMSVMGWSWGTVTSGRFAAKYPELAKKVVLYAPIVAGLGQYDINKPFNHNTWEHAAGDFQLNKKGEIDFHITEPSVVDAFQSNSWRYDKESSPNGGRRDLCVDASKRLIPTASIKAPVLIIAGTLDPYMTTDLCREAYATLKNKESKLVLIDGAAHAMMMEKPYYKVFRNNVLEFLKK